MKLVEKSKQAGVEQELLVKQHEQQLDQLRDHATEQTKMQVTIAQQSKLIDYLQDKTPTTRSTSKIRKVCRYIHLYVDSRMILILDCNVSENMSNAI